MHRLFLRATVLFVACLGTMLAPSFADAAPRRGYEALQVISTGGSRITMKPGEERQINVGFKNIGEKEWTRTGQEFISIYTYDHKYRPSAFEHVSWYRGTQPALLREDLVPVGQMGNILFTIKAPTNTGTYKETFHLAAEDRAWIPGGEFSLNIVVSDDATAPSVAVTPPPAATTPVSTAPAATEGSEGLGAFLLLRSQKQVVARGAETVKFKIGVKNTGTKTWNSFAVQTPQIAIASTLAAQTRHASWVSSTKLASNANANVAPGALEFIEFSFVAPRTAGQHIVRYHLSANGVVVPDFEIDIPVEVTSNAPNVLNQPVREEVLEFDPANFIDEPVMRVGILTVDEETDWQIIASCNRPAQLRDGQAALLGELAAGEQVTMFYKKGKYWYNRGKGLESSSFYLRLIPDQEEAVCTLHNFDRRKTRRAAYADNQFRGSLEIRYNEAKDRTWMINELPIELYLRGLAETSNYSHHEFKKVLITIARTYALYHWERGTKHKEEFYHVNAYADDQVYKGYEYETRHPLIGVAAEDTAGRVVTYEGRTAITPYFSRSDGRTRNWGEVWYGDVPWIKSVPTPCDAGKTLWGHGVGLSASAALCQARAGKKWDDILHYFYHNVDIDKRWE